MIIDNKRAIGKRYEEIAMEYLQSKSYEILATNFRCKRGEVDLIARCEDVLVFCEVKYRKNSRVGHPLESVDIRKQRRIIECAKVFLGKTDCQNYSFRFDVISILGSEILHIENAFEIV